MGELAHPPANTLVLPDVFRAMSDPVRLEIVRRLADRREHAYAAFEFDLSRATLSHHFRVLREAGLTRTRVDGKHRFVQLRHADLEARFPGLFRAVMAMLESGHGEAVAMRRAVRRPGTWPPDSRAVSPPMT
jgi:DNA-binding transcriptional ArsR family regulator